MSKRALETDIAEYPNKRSSQTPILSPFLSPNSTSTCQYCQFSSNMNGSGLTFEVKCPQCLNVTLFLYMPMQKFNKWQYLDGEHLRKS